MKVMVTGASGFVGRALVNHLHETGHEVTAIVRKNIGNLPKAVLVANIGSFASDTDWQSVLDNQQVVIHTAARVHVMNDHEVDPLEAFRKVNVDATLNLARQAALAGVKRFIFISSIKVNGEKTVAGQLFHADDVSLPQDAYGVSKHEAETGLRILAAETGMDVVIIRPPLVYGSGVKANFYSMMRWLNYRVPLPLGAINNKRSLVFIDNLIDLIVTCSYHPLAANQTFLVSDGEDLSTTDLLQRMGIALSKSALLLPVPVVFLQLAAKILGKGDVAQRLCDSLQVDITKTQKLLNWSPPVSVDEGLYKTAQSFHHEKTI